MSKSKTIKELNEMLEIEKSNRIYLIRHNITSGQYKNKVNSRIRKLKNAIEALSDDFKKDSISLVKMNLANYKGKKIDKKGRFTLKRVEVIEEELNESLSDMFISNENNKLLCQLSKAKITRVELNILYKTVELLKGDKHKLENGLFKFIKSKETYNNTQAVRIMEIIHKLRAYGWIKINDNNEIMVSSEYLYSNEGFKILKILNEYELTYGPINLIIKCLKIVSETKVNMMKGMWFANNKKIRESGLFVNDIPHYKTIYKVNLELFNGKGEPKNEGSD
ncbi:hypothetical protein HKB36_25905 [Vibrio parahaemolyticus]|uniref:hypothetical protein n=1 Tax=Vibrio parahaemolyticus TaxID=670 RepID=UPI00146E9C97|nr:hypothetical protein [Vibrio parahaemolyticus]MDF5453518.1 hypothetical protein [Vibrio parahaemolyticus]NMS06435.1 hypothetical protein [Vibrio parahaemolyticus]